MADRGNNAIRKGWPDFSSVAVRPLALSGNDTLVTIRSLPTWTYQLQAASSLTLADWTDIGPAQGGSGDVLTFTESGGATNTPARFYPFKAAYP